MLPQAGQRVKDGAFSDVRVAGQREDAVGCLPFADGKAVIDGVQPARFRGKSHKNSLLS